MNTLGDANCQCLIFIKTLNGKNFTKNFTKFENMCHLNFSIAYFAAETQNTNFSNFL